MKLQRKRDPSLKTRFFFVRCGGGGGLATAPWPRMATRHHVPKSTSDASRTGMAYLPKEAVTPRGMAFTHTDNLPQAGTTSPYKVGSVTVHPLSQRERALPGGHWTFPHDLQVEVAPT
jgi:hypothetical protein